MKKYTGKYPTRIHTVSGMGGGLLVVRLNNGDKHTIKAARGGVDMPKCGVELSVYANSGDYAVALYVDAKRVERRGELARDEKTAGATFEALRSDNINRLRAVSALVIVKGRGVDVDWADVDDMQRVNALVAQLEQALGVA